MRVAGIIAEYNPFHNGHAYHLQKTRELGATHIAVVMSSSFVQRGDIAACSKWARAEAALRGGADLIVELPALYALSPARNFARAGVALLHRLGADWLCFGSEEGDGERLRQAAGLAAEAERSALMGELLSRGLSYPRARAAAVAELYGGDWPQLITGANNLLGMEYIRAIQEIAPTLLPVTIPRCQTLHDGEESGETIASASVVRRHLRRGELAALTRYLPDSSFRICLEEISRLRAPVTERAVERLLLNRLRELTPEELALLPEVSEGLENRLSRAAKAAVSLEDFYMKAKTKRYTMARIRRISFCALLGITRELQQTPPSYLRVLGANRRGMEILARAKEREGVPISSKFASLYRQHPAGIETEVRATDLYALAMPSVHPCNLYFTTKPVIL